MGFVDQMAGTVEPSPQAAPGTAPTGFVERMAAGNLAQHGPSTVGEPQHHEEGYSPWEFLGNLAGDVGEMATGIGKLVQMGTHDIVGGVMQAIPGEQGGLERDIQQHGYQMDDVARGFFPALLQDYKNRYGFGGASEMAYQLYNNPLSYLMDALMVGDAAAAGARVAGKVGLIGEDAVAAVRGITPGIEDAQKLVKGMAVGPTKTVGNLMTPVPELASTAEGAAEIASKVAPTGAIPGLTDITLSVNPVKRWLQGKIIDHVLTTSAANMAERLDNPIRTIMGKYTNLPGAEVDAEARLAAASEAGTGVLRPFAEKFVAKKVAKKMFGISSSQFYEGRNAMLGDLSTIIKDLQERGASLKDLSKYAAKEGEDLTKEPLVHNIQQTNQALQQVHDGMVIQATGLPEQGPFMGLGLKENGIPDEALIRPEGAQPLMAALGQGETATNSGRAIFDEFNRDAHFNHLASPHNPEGIPLQTGAASFRREMGSMDQVGAEIQRLKAKLGATDVKVLNYMDGTLNDSYKGIHAFFTMQDGTVTEVSFATPRLAESQAIWSDLTQRVQGLRDVLSQPELAAASMDPMQAGRVVAHQAAMADEETRAALAQARRWMNAGMRNVHAPEGYDAMMETVDRLGLWEYKWGAKPFLDQYPKDWAAQGIDGPFTTLAKRAYGPLRHEMFRQTMNDFRNAVEARMKEFNAPGNTATMEDLKGEIISIMDDFGIPAGHFDETLGAYVKGPQDYIAESNFPTRLTPRQTETGTWIRSGPQILMDRARRALYQDWVVDATDKAWNWESFLESTPQLPGYFPHIRAMKRGDLLMKGADELAHGPGEVAFSKGWRGALMENGQYIKDPMEVYARVGSAYLRHQEIADVIRNALPLGRELSKAELNRYLENPETYKNANEVLWAPDSILRRLNLQGDIMEGIATKMDRGLSYDQAVDEALQDVNKMIQEGAIKDLQSAKVYAMPRHVAESMSKGIARRYGAEIRLFWDGPMNLWRATVLGINPRWLFYNMMGNIVFTGVKNPLALKRLRSLDEGNSAYIDAVLEEMHPGATTTLGRGNFATSENLLQRHWGSAEDKYPGMVAGAEKMKGLGVFSPVKRWTEFIRNKNSMVEYAARRGIALDQYAIDQMHGWGRVFESNMAIADDILKNGIDQPQFNRMLGAADKVLGDYISLNPLERDVLRRFIAPFYPFYRHTLKFVLRMPWENPVKGQIFRNLAEMDKDMAPILPDYLKGSINVGQIGGLPAYWNVQNFNPLNNFDDPRAGLMNFINPWLKVGIEGSLGINDFGDKFKSPDVYEAGNGMRFVLGENGWEPFEGNVHPPWWSMVAQQFGGPASMLNLQGYKNKTLGTSALGMAGLSLSRFDAAKYREQVLLGEMQAALHGGQ